METQGDWEMIAVARKSRLGACAPLHGAITPTQERGREPRSPRGPIPPSPRVLDDLLPETPTRTERLIRAFDIVGSLLILALAWPVAVVAMLLIRITSGGPVLYRQERVGKAGRVFTLYKLRTMINEAEKHVGPVWASKNDSRVTPIGGILRRMRIDELPQLYNVLRGDMSLVGPRPERPFFVERYASLRGVRLSVKPGLTGLAQVRRAYDLKPHHKVKYDSLYVRNRSLWLNIRIFFCTFLVPFSKKGW